MQFDSLNTGNGQIGFVDALLAIRFAEAVALLLSLGFGLTPLSTPSILLFNSSTVFVTAVTISIGVPFFPMKNNDGNGTNLSTIDRNWKIQRK